MRRWRVVRRWQAVRRRKYSDATGRVRRVSLRRRVWVRQRIWIGADRLYADRHERWRRVHLRRPRHARPWPDRPARAPAPDFRPQLVHGPGLPLSGLFDGLIARDPDIVGLIEAASGHCFSDFGTVYHCDGRAVLNRQFREDAPPWPAVLDGFDLFVEWCDTAGLRFEGRAPNEKHGLLDHLSESSLSGAAALRTARGAARCVRKRYEAMMVRLRDGRLEAFGHWRGSGEMARISTGIWSAPGTRVDFNENEVGRVIPSAAGAVSRVTQVEVMWSGVVVKLRPAEKLEAVPPMPARPERNKGGAPPKYPWEAGFARLMVRLGTKGLPETGAELARWLADCLEQEGAVGVDVDYVRQHLSAKYGFLWQTCLQGGPGSRR